MNDTYNVNLLMVNSNTILFIVHTSCSSVLIYTMLYGLMTADAKSTPTYSCCTHFWELI